MIFGSKYDPWFSLVPRTLLVFNACEKNGRAWQIKPCVCINTWAGKRIQTMLKAMIGNAFFEDI